MRHHVRTYLAVSLIVVSCITAFAHQSPLEITVDIENATLEEALKAISKASAKESRLGRMNFVIDARNIPESALNTRFSMSTPRVPAEHIVWAICRRLGIGYRVDPYAVFISSRQRAPLRPPPTRALAKIKDGGRLEGYLVLFVSQPKE
jgi:hypothetical protein